MTGVESPAFPLGREDLVQEVLATLVSNEGHGALLVGDLGLGKTSLVTAVLNLGGDKLRPFHVFGSPALSSEPFGVFAPFLTRLEDDRAHSSADVLRALASAFQTNTEAQTVLVIEDAQYLDDNSSALLAHLAAAGQARLVLVCGPCPAVPDELWSMCSNGLLQSFELGPLPVETMQQLCQQILGNQVLPSVSAALSRRADGNPLFLIEFIKHARKQGILVERNAVWLLLGQLSGSTELLQEIVRDHLSRLSVPQRQALEYIALAGTLSLSSLHRVSESSVVDELEEFKLIKVSSESAQAVSLGIMPMGEVICELLPGAKGLAMRLRLLSLLDLSTARPDALVRCVDWALEDGFEVSDGNMLKAAQLANQAHQLEIAEKASAALLAGKLKDPARLECARTMMLRGEYSALQALITDIMGTSSDPDVVRSAATLGGHDGVRPYVGETSIAEIAASWREALERLIGEGSLPDGQLLTEHRHSVRLLEMQIMFGAGNYHGTENELEQILASSSSPMNRLVACTLLSEFLSATGRTNQAVEFSSRAIDVLERNLETTAYLREFVLRRHFIALAHSGQFDLLYQRLEQNADHPGALLQRCGGSCQLAKGLGQLAQGRVNDALQTLGQAVEALLVSDPGNDLPQGLAAGAYAAAVLGRENLKDRYAEMFADAGPGRDAASTLRSRAYLLAAAGIFEGNPRAKLRLVADEAAALGMVHVEMDVLKLGIHAGDMGLALRLKAVASRCEGRNAQNTAAYARALAEKDPLALMAFSEVAEDEGRELDAARSAENAVVILSRRTDKHSLHSAQRVAKRRLAMLVYGRDPLSARLSMAPQLTRRERKVAALVHAGATNRAIAAEFGLSLRTVEGHLYRIFAKLGISERSEISNAAADPWNTQTGS